MKRPFILVTCDRAEVGNPARPSHFAHEAYVGCIANAGGVPLVLPLLQERFLAEALDRADGVLLTGGRDYRAAGLHSAVELCDRAREQRDLALWPLVLDRHPAVLGICLGMQLMNLGSGGTLYQDLRSQVPKSRRHRRSHHGVAMVPGTRLAGLLGESITVNSNHHQAVRTLGTGLLPAAHSSDGVLEAMEMPGRRFMVGVQWHPERMPTSSIQQALFAAFVRAAANGGCWA